jgi:hypothetical protein
MAEIIICKSCGQFINLEIDIYRDENGNVYCRCCDTLIINNS